MSGILYGVGVGSGDPELLTLKSVRILREADIIALPAETAGDSIAYQIAVQAVPEIAEKEQLGLSFPMIKEKEQLKTIWEKNAEQLRKKLIAGKKIAFPVLGDPCIYSTFSYVERLLRKQGFRTEYINGIPSFCAASAALGMPLVQGNEPLHILPGRIDYERKPEGTLVLMKAAKQLKEMKAALAAWNMEGYLLERCGLEGERAYTMEELPESADYLSLIIGKERKNKENT